MIRSSDSVAAEAVVPYERRLNQDFRWAMDEGSQFFEGKGAVHAALRRITAKLDELGVDYAVSGGMALFGHGYRRYTEDVDILVTRDGLRAIHDALDGLGYVPPFRGSKNLRDVHEGVKIEFLIEGDYPGDGKPKPVAFPAPSAVAEEIDGIKFLRLTALIELKLASGMTNPGRLKDLADVQEIIRALRLPESLEEQLNPFVRERFVELHRAASASDEGESA